ncbi:hypothetical protein D3C87_1461260 [compost metagenome]
MHVRQRAEAQHQRLDRTGQARQRGRDHEGQQLEAIDIVSKRNCARFVLLDGLEDLAERRVHGTHDQCECRHDDGQRHVVQRDVLGEREHAEQLAARNALQAVLAARERRLQADEEQHLRQRQRDHREIDALAPDGQRADHVADARPGQCAEDQAHFRRHAPDLHRVAGRVAGAAEERRVAEREQPGKADQQVECAREQREAHHLQYEHRVGARHRGHDQPQQQQAVKHLLLHTRSVPDGSGANRHRGLSGLSAHHFSLPNRPAGRNNSTITMMKNTTVADASG